MRWKTHPSGAIECIPDPSDYANAKISEENKKLSEENTTLKKSMNSLLDLLAKKDVLTSDEADEFKKEVK